MGYDLDTRPGGWVLAQTRLRVQRGAVAFTILASAALGTIALTFVYRPAASVLAIVLLASVLVLRPRANRYVDRLINWQRGGEAEQALDWLRAQRNKPVEFERLARFADRV